MSLHKKTKDGKEKAVRPPPEATLSPFLTLAISPHMPIEIHALRQRKLSSLRVHQLQIHCSVSLERPFGIINRDIKHALRRSLIRHALIARDLIRLLMPFAYPTHLPIHQPPAVTLGTHTPLDVNAGISLLVVQIDDALHGGDVEIVDHLAAREVTDHPFFTLGVGAGVHEAVVGGGVAVAAGGRMGAEGLQKA